MFVNMSHSFKCLLFKYADNLQHFFFKAGKSEVRVPPFPPTKCFCFLVEAFIEKKICQKHYERKLVYVFFISSENFNSCAHEWIQDVKEKRQKENEKLWTFYRKFTDKRNLINGGKKNFLSKDNRLLITRLSENVLHGSVKSKQEQQQR